MKLRILLGISLVLVGAYLAVSWYFSSIIVVFNPPERDAEWSETWEPEWEIAVSETVEISSGENTIVVDVYDNPAEADCAVITVHGLGGYRTIAQVYGPLVWDTGCDVVAYDFAPINNDVLLTYGYYERQTLSNVLDWIAETYDISIGNIGIIGQSYGGATALQLLEERSDMAWIIADSSYSSMTDIISYQAVAQFGQPVAVMVPGALFLSSIRADFNPADVSPMDAVVGSNVPVLITHSLQDEYTPSTHSETIYEMANAENTQLVVTDWDTPHAYAAIAEPVMYEEMIDAFLVTYAPEFGQ